KKKPVGTVWVAFAKNKRECISTQHNFYSSRDNFIDKTTNEGFSKLIRFIKEKN
ncbi:MAG: CinA family protein, partial [Bacteroidales bacterium]|nr:CinA family protein [Bacteroidales bacterium]